MKTLYDNNTLEKTERGVVEGASKWSGGGGGGHHISQYNVKVKKTVLFKKKIILNFK